MMIITLFLHPLEFQHIVHIQIFGKNAISPIIIVLYEFFQKYNINIELLSIFRHYIHVQYNGRDLNIDLSDESRKSYIKYC